MDINKEKNKYGTKEEREKIWAKVEKMMKEYNIDIKLFDYQKEMIIDTIISGNKVKLDHRVHKDSEITDNGLGYSSSNVYFDEIWSKNMGVVEIGNEESNDSENKITKQELAQRELAKQDLLSKLAESEKDIQEGRYYSLEEVDKMMKRKFRRGRIKCRLKKIKEGLKDMFIGYMDCEEDIDREKIYNERYKIDTPHYIKNIKNSYIDKEMPAKTYYNEEGIFIPILLSRTGQETYIKVDKEAICGFVKLMKNGKEI